MTDAAPMPIDDLAEKIIGWVVDTFASNARYLDWLDRQSEIDQLALGLVDTIIMRLDHGWSAARIERDTGRESRAALEGLYARHIAPTEPERGDGIGEYESPEPAYEFGGPA
jgi:hypothetical protein